MATKEEKEKFATLIGRIVHNCGILEWQTNTLIDVLETDKIRKAKMFTQLFGLSRRPCRNASMRAGIEAMGGAFRNPIRATFVGCCASANVPAAKRTRATNQRSLLNTAFTFQRNGYATKRGL